MKLLEVEGLTKLFGGLMAVSADSYEVSKRELFSIIGPNGAGKTTLFNMVTGFLHPSGGKILFAGEDITGKSPHAVARRGIVRTFQATTLFRKQTVLDNLIVAHQALSRSGLLSIILNNTGARKNDALIREKSLELLELLGLIGVKDELAMNLPHGHQRKLEVSIALAAQPRLLLLDEPVVGMNTEETAEMMELVRKLQQIKDITVILVEHDMKAVMGFSDRLMVLNYGRKIAEGSPEDIKRNKDVIEAYLGRDKG